MGDIADNIAVIKEKIYKAAIRSGRKPEDVKLIAVTKTRSPEEIEEVFEAGLVDVAENRVTELLRKEAATGKDFRWHLIGHLQTNKVKKVMGKTVLIHSLDSIRLAEEIERCSENAGFTTDVLIQVNAAREEQKYGIAPELAEGLAIEISKRMPHLRLRGLMEIAPFAEDPEDVRIYFRMVHRLYDKMAGEGVYGEFFDTLSMGMSNDFEVAVEEGSNAVRIGRAIFEKRD